MQESEVGEMKSSEVCKLNRHFMQEFSDNYMKGFGGIESLPENWRDLLQFHAVMLLGELVEQVAILNEKETQ